MKAKPMYFYRFWRSALGFFSRPLHRMRAVGLENVPESGRAIIASSHVHAIDPVLIGYMLRRDIHTLAKKELFDNPIVGATLSKLGAIKVTRSHADPSAVSRAVEVLESEGMLLVFPEGTRSKTGELGLFKSGAAMFSIETRAPVIPATIIAPDGLKPFRPVTVVFGEAIPASELGESPATRAALRSATELIRSRVAALQKADYSR